MTTTNEDDESIVIRFFNVLDELILLKRIRGIQTFTERYGINRWNFLSLRRDVAAGRFRPSWLMYLVRDYGVSAEYLLTGEGSMFAQTLAQEATLSTEQADQLTSLARSIIELAESQKVQNLCKASKIQN